jgi:nucleotide-binding universal stress UspA family protein
VELEWRGALSSPTGLLIDSARAADLIVTTSPKEASIGNAQRSVDLGSLILRAGRPVLVASTGEEHFLTNNVLIAWKDTREARRAVADAMPILQIAKEVRIITIDKAATDDTWKSLRDVAAFLSHHGVKAATEVFPEQSDGHMIADLANAMNADMIISGAYGHSRLREWIFGGATRSMLENDRRTVSCRIDLPVTTREIARGLNKLADQSIEPVMRHQSGWSAFWTLMQFIEVRRAAKNQARAGLEEPQLAALLSHIRACRACASEFDHEPRPDRRESFARATAYVRCLPSSISAARRSGMASSS